jgi:hypothetical protein
MYYIIYKNKVIEQITKDKEEAEKRESLGYSVTHWDISVSGDLPDMDVDFSDTRGYAEKRKCAYKMELDPKWDEYNGMRIDGDYTASEVDSLMQSAKNAIKQKYPKS